jgi:hypothetical protein
MKYFYQLNKISYWFFGEIQGFIALLLDLGGHYTGPEIRELYSIHCA